MAGPTRAGTTSKPSAPHYGPALALLATLFFMWGFITVINNTLLPHLRSVFQLNYTQTTLIESTWFIGYLVASIRADYQAPGDFVSADAEAKVQEAERAADVAKRQEQQRVRDESDRAQSREAELRAAWERLPDAEREAILAAVKAENPGLSRWKRMLEPLCLAALEARLKSPRAAQKTLFPEG